MPGKNLAVDKRRFLKDRLVQRSLLWFLFSFTVLQRCLPHVSPIKGNLTIGNGMQFEDGSERSRNVIELTEAAKYVYVSVLF